MSPVFDPLYFDPAYFDTAPGASLQAVSLLDLVPSNLRADPFVKALAVAFDSEFHALVAETARLLLYAALDDQPAAVCDHLAFHLGVDFYDQAATVEAKRELIRKAIYWARIKGTPRAIERVISIVFGEGTVSEWFEYGGEPFQFRVSSTGGKFPTDERFKVFLRMIRVVKRASAILERITVLQSSAGPVSVGGVLQIGTTIHLGSA